MKIVLTADLTVILTNACDPVRFAFLVSSATALFLSDFLFMPPKPKKYVEEIKNHDDGLKSIIPQTRECPSVQYSARHIPCRSFLSTGGQKLYLATHHAYVAYSIFDIMMLWWVLRIVFGWYV
jgi:hypothetical protein